LKKLNNKKNIFKIVQNFLEIIAKNIINDLNWKQKFNKIF